ncbi:WhiB family transcriptional regulator [Pseudonocardia sp. C8]|nr:WhiB family transcriptional regulator [Pseudonocardia sp. C8]
MIRNETGGGCAGSDEARSRSAPARRSGPPSALPCRNGDADLWFAESPAELEEAKALCATCPVRDACLAGALDRGEPWGVWGGEIFERGRVIPRKRPRGRPRKADLERDRAFALAAGS